LQLSLSPRDADFVRDIDYGCSLAVTINNAENADDSERFGQDPPECADDLQTAKRIEPAMKPKTHWAQPW